MFYLMGFVIKFRERGTKNMNNIQGETPLHIWYGIKNEGIDSGTQNNLDNILLTMSCITRLMNQGNHGTST